MNDTHTAYRARAAATERMVDQAVAEVTAERDAKFAANAEAAKVRNAPVPFTEAEYLAAKVIRTRLGWYEVIRVNAKSVTVKTAYSWADRVGRSKILEVR